MSRPYKKLSLIAKMRRTNKANVKSGLKISLALPPTKVAAMKTVLSTRRISTVQLSLLLFFLSWTCGCNDANEKLASFKARTADETVTKTKLNPRDSKAGKFTLVESSGIDFENTLKPENQIPYLTNGAGVSIGDFDNDGQPDIFFAGQDADNRLYRQVGDFKFEDVTAKAGVSGAGKISGGATFVDINNDGFLDIYVCNYLTNNELFVNQKDGTFIEQAWDYNLAYSGPCPLYKSPSPRDRG